MRESRLATIALVSLVLINQLQVAINVRLSFFNRDWFNAIQEKNAEQFWTLLFTVFLFWAAIYIVIAILEYVIQSGLTIRWRQWLTDNYVSEWLGEGTHYRMALSGDAADNPDQRIAVDIDRFIDQTYGFSITLIATVSSLVSFSIILWTISASFTIPGTELVIPGLLFWVALVYAGVGTLITHLIGRALVPLNFAQQRYEADFRFSLARLREYAEQVALLEGETAERQIVMGRFGNVIHNFWSIVNLRKRLMAFTASYGQISPIIPYVIAAPFYFLGKVQLGVLTQTAGAFGRVEGALTFFINYYVTLADYKAVIDRLTTFGNSIHRAQSLGRKPPHIDLAKHAGQDVRLDGLDLRLPTGRTIVTVPGLAFHPGESSAAHRCIGFRQVDHAARPGRHLALWRGTHRRSQWCERDASAAAALHPHGKPSAGGELPCSLRDLSGRAVARGAGRGTIARTRRQPRFRGELGGPPLRWRAAAPRHCARAPGQTGLAVPRRGHFRSRRVHGGGDLQDARRKAAGYDGDIDRPPHDIARPPPAASADATQR